MYTHRVAQPPPRSSRGDFCHPQQSVLTFSRFHFPQPLPPLLPRPSASPNQPSGSGPPAPSSSGSRIRQPEAISGRASVPHRVLKARPLCSVCQCCVPFHARPVFPGGDRPSLFFHSSVPGHVGSPLRAPMNTAAMTCMFRRVWTCSCFFRLCAQECNCRVVCWPYDQFGEDLPGFPKVAASSHSPACHG